MRKTQWPCPKCNKENGKNRHKCWNCGTKRPAEEAEEQEVALHGPQELPAQEPANELEMPLGTESDDEFVRVGQLREYHQQNAEVLKDIYKEIDELKMLINDVEDASKVVIQDLNQRLGQLGSLVTEIEDHLTQKSEPLATEAVAPETSVLEVPSVGVSPAQAEQVIEEEPEFDLRAFLEEASAEETVAGEPELPDWLVSLNNSVEKPGNTTPETGSVWGQQLVEEEAVELGEPPVSFEFDPVEPTAAPAVQPAMVPETKVPLVHRRLDAIFPNAFALVRRKKA